MKGRAGGCLHEGIKDCDPRLEVGGRESNRFHLCGCDSPEESFCWPFSLSEGKYCSPCSLPLPHTPGLALLAVSSRVVEKSLCSPGCPQTDISEEDSHAAVIPSYAANSEKSTGCCGGCCLKIPEQSGRHLLHTPYPPLQASENILASASTTAGSSTCLACQQVPAPGEEYCQPSPRARPLSLAIGWMTGDTPIASGRPRVSQHK